jgi:hypothetical protein
VLPALVFHVMNAAGVRAVRVRLEVAVNCFVSREGREGSEVREGATELRSLRFLRSGML